MSRTKTNLRTDREQYTRSNAATARPFTLVNPAETLARDWPNTNERQEMVTSTITLKIDWDSATCFTYSTDNEPARASGFFRFSFTRRENPSAKPSREKISVTSAVSDQSQFTLHIRRSNARVFAWISRKRLGKYCVRCFEERMGSFRVWKTQQASRGSLATCYWIKERCFRESSNWFRKVCSILGFVYRVFLCGTNKLEPKKPDALEGYSLYCVQPSFF